MEKLSVRLQQMSDIIVMCCKSEVMKQHLKLRLCTIKQVTINSTKNEM